MTGHVDVALDDVRVGDMAHRLDQDLDARPVAQVWRSGDTIGAVSLRIGSVSATGTPRGTSRGPRVPRSSSTWTGSVTRLRSTTRVRRRQTRRSRTRSSPVPDPGSA